MDCDCLFAKIWNVDQRGRHYVTGVGSCLKTVTIAFSNIEFHVSICSCGGSLICHGADVQNEEAISAEDAIRPIEFFMMVGLKQTQMGNWNHTSFLA
jgi:hypothetical protein